MTTISLQVEDSYVDKLLELLKQCPKDVVKINDSYQNMVEERYTKTVTVNTREEIEERLTTAKTNIAKGNYLDEDTFWSKVDKHLETL